MTPSDRKSKIIWLQTTDSTNTEIKRRIDSLVSLQGLLGGYAAFKYISVIISIIADIISHKLGSALNEREISLYHRLIPLGAVQKLSKIDDVRLLPYKE